MLKNIVILFSVLVFFPSSFVHAQKNIGKVDQETINEDQNLMDIPIEQWVGKKFIFLEKPQGFQKYGYSFSSSKKSHYDCTPSEFVLETSCNLKYDRFVNKIITVVDIESNSPNYIVTFVEDESGKELFYETHLRDIYVDEIALFDDIEKAKDRWLGKTIYSRKRSIKTYSEDLDKYGEVEVKIGDALKVIDILWGFDARQPLWIVVETINGERGFLSTSFSWTNTLVHNRSQKRPWEYVFFEVDPKEKYKWSAEIWGLINDGKVRIGMKDEQVALSWGIPRKMNRDIYGGVVREQWIYSGRYLYFENSRLVGIQSR